MNIMKLDKKDRRILYELDRDARQPLAVIARKVGLSRESILYRVRQYLKEGLLRGYLTVVDMAKLGFVHYKVFIRLQNLSQDAEKELVQWLCANPFVTWVSSCDGAYSLIIAVKARSVVELKVILRKINNRYWKHFKDQHITTIVNARHYPRKYLVGAKESREVGWGGSAGAAKLDESDLAILDELCRNTRATAVEIAALIKRSPDLVLQRMRSLEKQKVIQYYTLWPDVNKLIGAYYKVLVKLHNMNDAKEREIQTYCSQQPHIVYIVGSLGDWQLELDIEAQDIAALREVIREFTAKFSEVTSDYTVLSVYNEHKFRFFEKAIFSQKA